MGEEIAKKSLEHDAMYGRSRWERFSTQELLAMLYALYHSDIPITAKLAYEILAFIGMTVEHDAVDVAEDEYFAELGR